MENHENIGPILAINDELRKSRDWWRERAQINAYNFEVITRDVKMQIKSLIFSALSRHGVHELRQKYQSSGYHERTVLDLLLQNYQEMQLRMSAAETATIELTTDNCELVAKNHGLEETIMALQERVKQLS